MSVYCNDYSEAARSGEFGRLECVAEDTRTEEKAPTRLSLFWQKNGWFGLLLIAAALVLFGVSGILKAAAEREQSSAIETEGTVANILVLESGQRVSEADKYDETDYRVYVDFIVDTGRQYDFIGESGECRASQSVPQGFFEELTEGQSVSLRYSADDPGRIWATSDQNPWASDLRFLGYLLLLLGLFLAWGPWVVAGNELKNSS